MAVEGFDGEAFKASTRDQWQGVAEAWHRWVPTMAARLAPMTELMFDMADISAGDRVLDLAAGDGDQSLAAARRVGSDGFVLSTDIASNLVAYAQHAADSAGLEHMRAEVMDAENLALEDGPFSLGGDGVLADALQRAGFVDVEVEAVSAPCKMESAAQCAQMERETFGALQQMLAGLDQAEQDDIWAEIESELGQFDGDDGFESPSEELVGVGTKPA